MMTNDELDALVQRVKTTCYILDPEGLKALASLRRQLAELQTDATLIANANIKLQSQLTAEREANEHLRETIKMEQECQSALQGELTAERERAEKAEAELNAPYDREVVTGTSRDIITKEILGITIYDPDTKTSVYFDRKAERERDAALAETRELRERADKYAVDLEEALDSLTREKSEHDEALIRLDAALAEARELRERYAVEYMLLATFNAIDAKTAEEHADKFMEQNFAEAIYIERGTNWQIIRHALIDAFKIAEARATTVAHRADVDRESQG